MTLWLKLIGTADNPWDDTRQYDRDYVGFRGRRPSGIRPGDQMVLYAVGPGRVFALTKVETGWGPSREPGWPYQVRIAPCEPNLAPRDGVDIDEIDEDLRWRLRRRSHMKLSEEIFERAVAKLEEAVIRFRARATGQVP
jgi:hypothetical protein